MEDRQLTIGCTRGGVRVRDDGWITRAARVTLVVRCLGRRTISIPPLSSAGDLPVGVHRSTLAELSAAFGCASRERQILFERIARIYRIAAATRHLARFVVFGSFVSQKPVPNDGDIFMVFDDAFDASICDHETMCCLIMPRQIRILVQACFGFGGLQRLAANSHY